MIIASIVTLFFVICRCQLSPHEALCDSVEYPDVCVKTWGCFWESGDAGDFCAEQDDYKDGVGMCPAPPYDPGYTCFSSASGYYYVYDGTAPYDSCSFAEYDNDGTCPENAEGNPCVFLPTSATDQVGGCYVDPAYGSSWDYSEAGICGGRKAGGGCLGIPNCEWVNGSCMPDDLCYYNYTNGGVSGECATVAHGGHCSFDSDISICSSDPINGKAKKCMQANDGTPATCKSAGCEWIEGGTYAAWSGQWGGKYDSFLSFNGWCVPVGSGASVVSMSTFAVVLLFAGVLSLI